jgi:hypothetical protein
MRKLSGAATPRRRGGGGGGESPETTALARRECTASFTNIWADTGRGGGPTAFAMVLRPGVRRPWTRQGAGAGAWRLCGIVSGPPWRQRPGRSAGRLWLRHCTGGSGGIVSAPRRRRRDGCSDLMQRVERRGARALSKWVHPLLRQHCRSKIP